MEDSEEDNSAEEALVDIEDLFKRKQLSETSLADLAIKSLEPYLDELPEKDGIFSLGNSVTTGGKIDGSVRATGNFVAKGVTVMDSMFGAGNSVARDLVVIRKGTTLAGNNVFRSNAVFAGKTRLAGNNTFSENIIASTKLSLSGTSVVKKQILTDAPLNLRGNLSVNQIQALDKIFVRGTIKVEKMVKARKFQLSQGKGSIGDDLIAKEVGIGRNKQLKRYLRNYERDFSLANPVNLVKFIGNSLFGGLFDRRKSGDPVEIHGDIIAHDIFLDNVIVHGEINAKRITIGDNVEIKGKAEFSESFISLTGKEYNSERIGTDQLLYLGPGHDEKDVSGEIAQPEN